MKTQYSYYASKQTFDETQIVLHIHTHTCQRPINLLEDLLPEQVDKPRDYLMRSNGQNKTYIIQAQRGQANSHHCSFGIKSKCGVADIPVGIFS